MSFITLFSRCALIGCFLFFANHLLESQVKTKPAISFLQSLDQDTRKKAILKLDDPVREQWHYFPSTMYKREGVMVGDMNIDQRKKCFALLEHHLSIVGYRKVLQIIDLENILADMENNPDFRDPDKYYIAFYGDPQSDKEWAWSFEGHHLSLNFTIVGDEVAMAPRFFGANPAEVKEGKKKGMKVLELEEAYGFELIQSMDEHQKAKAIISVDAPMDIFTVNDSSIDPLKNKGIAMKDLKRTQKQLLWDLINVYLSNMPENLAKQRLMQVMEEEVDNILFAWAGFTLPGKPHYYRIQGKTFLVEYDNVQTNANHIHTVWRDFDGDFGRDLLREHYKNSKHH